MPAFVLPYTIISYIIYPKEHQRENIMDSSVVWLVIFIAFAIGMTIVLFDYEKKYQKEKHANGRVGSSNKIDRIHHDDQLSRFETVAMLKSFEYNEWQKCYSAWMQNNKDSQWYPITYSLTKGNVWVDYRGVRLTDRAAFDLLVLSNIGIDDDHQTHPKDVQP